MLDSYFFFKNHGLLAKLCVPHIIFIYACILQSVRLERGTDQFNRWEELPFPLHFKVYAFHVVNPDAILEGARPIVQEVGPFVYKYVVKIFVLLYPRE